MQKWAVCVPKLPWVFRLFFLSKKVLIALRLREVQMLQVLGRTLVNAVYWKNETESFYFSVFRIFFLYVTAPHINMLLCFIISRKISCGLEGYQRSP